MEMVNMSSYVTVLQELKAKIREARYRAILSVNKEMIFLYWDIGAIILDQQQKQGWGAKVIDKLSKDLTRSFPDMKGLSTRNLKYMRQFTRLYPDYKIVQEALAQLTWYHIITLMDKVKGEKERFWYAVQAIKNGWSRSVLVHQIESDVFSRSGKAVTNFKATLPPPQSDLARQIIKDPYNFDFLALKDDYNERVLEKALIDEVQRFLLELGAGG